MRLATALAGTLLLAAGIAGPAGAVPPPAMPLPSVGELATRAVDALLDAGAVRVDVDVHGRLDGPSGGLVLDGPAGTVTWSLEDRQASGRLALGPIHASFRVSGPAAWVRLDPFTDGWWRLPVTALVPVPLARELAATGAAATMEALIGRALAQPGATASVGPVPVACGRVTCWQVAVAIPDTLLAGVTADTGSGPGPSASPRPALAARVLVEAHTGWPARIEIDATSDPASPLVVGLSLSRTSVMPRVRPPRGAVSTGPIAELPGSLPWPSALVPPSPAPEDRP